MDINTDLIIVYVCMAIGSVVILSFIGFELMYWRETRGISKIEDNSWYTGFLEAEAYTKEYGYSELLRYVHTKVYQCYKTYDNPWNDYLNHVENTLPKMIMVEGLYVPRDIELYTKNHHTRSSAAEKSVRRKLKSFREERVL